jgi:hypothetical protein
VTAAGIDVANRDLFQALEQLLWDAWTCDDVSIYFWRVHREENQDADWSAKLALDHLN